MPVTVPTEQVATDQATTPRRDYRTISVRIPTRIEDQLSAICERDFCSLSSVVRRLVSEALRRESVDSRG